MTDLGEIVRARLAEKVAAGKSPTKADLAWLDATEERRVPASAVKTERIRTGEILFEIKVEHADPYEAERISTEITARMRATYPMQDGTAGAPMVEPS